MKGEKDIAGDVNEGEGTMEGIKILGCWPILGVSNSLSLGAHQPRGCLQRAKCNFRTVSMQLLLNWGQGAQHCCRVETRC